MSEIEPPDVIEPAGTVSPDITHEEIIKTSEESPSNQFNVGIVQEVSNQEISENEIQPPQLPEQEIPQENFVVEEEIPSIPTTSAAPRKKGRKNKKPNVQEDNNIDSEFASRLDMSCADAETIAPQIENAHVADYIR